MRKYRDISYFNRRQWFPLIALAGAAAGGGGAAAGGGAGLAGLGALLGGAGGLAGAMGGKSKQRTPGFGLTNADEIMQLMSMVGFGTNPSWETRKYFGGIGEAGGATGLGALQGMPNIMSILNRSVARDLPQFNQLFQQAQGILPWGDAQIANLLAQATGGTNRAVGEAKDVRGRALGALSGGYAGAKESATRYLDRTIKQIFRMSNANAASRGIKSTVTTGRAASQSKQAAESVSDLLAQIGMREAEQTAGIEQQTGAGIMQTLLSRLAGEDALRQFGFSAGLGLREGNIQNLLNLMGQRRALETLPQTTALSILGGFPGYSSTGSLSPSAGQTVGNALSGLGGTLVGYQNYVQGQQQQQALMRLLQSAVG